MGIVLVVGMLHKLGGDRRLGMRGTEMGRTYKRGTGLRRRICVVELEMWGIGRR
jgi:hypothetical protein